MIEVNWRRNDATALDNWRHAEQWKKASGPKQTVEEYLAQGGQITQCPTAILALVETGCRKPGRIRSQF